MYEYSIEMCMCAYCTFTIHKCCSWNRSGRKLLSSSTDWNVMLWDVASGDVDLRLRFPSPVLRAQFHPRDTSVTASCIGVIGVIQIALYV